MATIDGRFYTILVDVTYACQYIGEYLTGVGTQRRWMIPSADLVGWQFDPTDVPTVGTPFDRANVNYGYGLQYSGGAGFKVNDIMGYSVEINYMGMMERAFRERHKLVTRATLHAAGRKKAHGDASYGVHIGAVAQYVTNLFSVT